MNDDHLPTQEFQAQLEWQIRTELRRRQRFGAEATGEPCGSRFDNPVSRWRWTRTAALVVISMVLGAGGILAAEHYQNSRRAEILLEQTRLRLQLAEARLADARADLERVEAVVHAGVAGNDERLAAQQRAAEATGQVELERSYLEEIGLSGRAPRDGISAPLVAGRDFVDERLRDRRTAASNRLQAARQRLERLQELSQANLVSESELRRAEDAVDAARVEVEAYDDRLRLRRRFIASELSPQEVERENLRNSARRAQERLLQQLTQAREDLERAQKLAGAGSTSSAETQRAETRVHELQVELRLAELQQRLVDEQSPEKPAGNGR